jgi:hypothetical protein
MPVVNVEQVDKDGKGYHIADVTEQTELMDTSCVGLPFELNQVKERLAFKNLKLISLSADTDKRVSQWTFVDAWQNIKHVLNLVYLFIRLPL